MGPNATSEAQPQFQSTPQPGVAAASPDARPWPPMGPAVPLPGVPQSAEQAAARPAWGVGQEVAAQPAPSADAQIGAPVVAGMKLPEQPGQPAWGVSSLGKDVAQAIPAPATAPAQAAWNPQTLGPEVGTSVAPDPNAKAPEIQGITTPSPAEQAAMDPVPDVLKNTTYQLNFGGSTTPKVDPPATAAASAQASEHAQNFAVMQPGVDLPPNPLSGLPTTDSSISALGTAPEATVSAPTSEPVNAAPEPSPTPSPTEAPPTSGEEIKLTEDEKKLVQFGHDMALLYSNVDNQALKDEVYKRWIAKLDEISEKYK